MPKHIQRLKMTIAYNGQAYQGWQSQTHGNTVQDRLESALEEILQRAVPAHGAGRTDAGVHALRQCAHADVNTDRLLPWQWRNAINAHLPPDIRILHCSATSEAFHARFSATGKHYRYNIWNATVLHPLQNGRAWHLPKKIDIETLCTNAAQFIGEHDFAAFAANRGKPGENTVRTIYSVSVKKRGSLMTLSFTGNGFLYHMVRLMVGTLVRSAHERSAPDYIHKLLNSEGKTPFCAPACGLYLVRVLYGQGPGARANPNEKPS